jgi:hypothetical protein
MTEALPAAPLPKDFLARVERALVPGTAEPFSKETKQTRNFLLVASFFLILVVLALVEIPQQPLKDYTATVKGLQWILVALCAYFELVLSARSYLEWKFWRLRQHAPWLEIIDLMNSAQQHQADRIKETVARLDVELGELRAANSSPAEIDALRTRRNVLMTEWEKQRAEADVARGKFQSLRPEDAMSDAGQALWAEVRKTWSAGQDAYARLQTVSDELEKRSAFHRAQTDQKNEQLRKRISETGNQLTKSANEPVSDVQYAEAAVKSVARAVRVRFWTELLFPLLVGIFAIALAVAKAFLGNDAFRWVIG